MQYGLLLVRLPPASTVRWPQSRGGSLVTEGVAGEVTGWTRTWKMSGWSLYPPRGWLIGGYLLVKQFS